MDPTSHSVYVANWGSRSISVIDGSTKEIASVIPVGDYPNDVAVGQTTHTVYVANWGSDTVSEIKGS